MATTSRGIPLLDGTEPVAPVQGFFNGIAQALDGALETQEAELGKRANLVVLTNAQMIKMFEDKTGWNGLHCFNTTNKKLYVWLGNVWNDTPLPEEGVFSYNSPFSRYSTNMATHDAHASRQGRIVTLDGTAGVPSGSQINGLDGITMFTLGVRFRPPRRVPFLQQGSSRAQWLMEVWPDGKVTASRYDTPSHSNVWLPFSATFWAAQP